MPQVDAAARSPKFRRGGVDVEQQTGLPAARGRFVNAFRGPRPNGRLSMPGCANIRATLFRIPAPCPSTTIRAVAAPSIQGPSRGVTWPLRGPGQSVSGSMESDRLNPPRTDRPPVEALDRQRRGRQDVWLKGACISVDMCRFSIARHDEAKSTPLRRPASESSKARIAGIGARWCRACRYGDLAAVRLFECRVIFSKGVIGSKAWPTLALWHQDC